MTQQSVTSTQNAAPQKSRRQQKVGRVVSNKMDKTIVVVVETLKKHRIYKRTYKQTKRFHAHDEDNVCQIGDIVRIEESRPISKLKRWRLVEVVKQGSGIVPVKNCWLTSIPISSLDAPMRTKTRAVKQKHKELFR